MKVSFITEVLMSYRKRFHELLKSHLEENGISYNLIYGVPKNKNERWNKTSINWALEINNHYYPFFGKELIWQPCLNLIKDADLVIIEQANRFLINYLLLLKRSFSKQKIAFFGHGANFQKRNFFSDYVKRLFINKVDWWFAYNKLSYSIVQKAGFPADRITDIQNSIDIESLVQLKKSISKSEILQIKEDIGLNTKPVGIFCGRMNKWKRIKFILKSCYLIKSKFPGFQMIFIGEGEDSYLVNLEAINTDWIHYVGPKFMREKIPYFCLADIFLNPGSVGLAVLDSFALEVPMVTTRNEYHCPEILYLKNGYNGFVTDDNIFSYSESICKILSDEEKYNYLKEGCIKSAHKYSIKNMSYRFAEGIKQCIEIV